VELDAEMTVIESRISPAIAFISKGDRDIIAQEIDGGNRPCPSLTQHRE
jgi:hypothetical protein